MAVFYSIRPDNVKFHIFHLKTNKWINYLDFADDTQTNLWKRNSGTTGLKLEDFAKINIYLSVAHRRDR